MVVAQAVEQVPARVAVARVVAQVAVAQVVAQVAVARVELAVALAFALAFALASVAVVSVQEQVPPHHQTTHHQSLQAPLSDLNPL